MSDTSFVRNSGRALDQMRDITVDRGFLEYAEGSCLISFGKTRVLCSASVDDKVPPFLVGAEQGWLTAEYNMLPKSTIQRTPRERMKGGRTQEIQRLIGRSLRCVTNLEALGERTIYIDCDVIQADGGTRTAAISGASIALYDACQFMIQKELIEENPMKEMVAAISVGVVDGISCLDLDYKEDSSADVDFNVVKTASGKYVEIQGTAELKPFEMEELQKLLGLADTGIEKILDAQKTSLQI